MSNDDKEITYYQLDVNALKDKLQKYADMNNKIYGCCVNLDNVEHLEIIISFLSEILDEKVFGYEDSILYLRNQLVQIANEIDGENS